MTHRGLRLAVPVMLLALASAGLGQRPASARSPLPDGAETFDAAWTIIRDSHFDARMNGLDWTAVRAELRPRAAAATSAGELRAVIRDMLQRLGLSHFALIPSTADLPGANQDLEGAPGFDVRLVGDSLLVTRVDPGVTLVRQGWRLVTIGRTDVQALIDKLPGRARHEGRSPDVTASAPPRAARLANVEAWRVVQSLLRGPAGSRLEATFEDGSGRRVAAALDRHPETGEPVTVGSLPTMFVRVETGLRRTPAGGTAGLIAFNVWMTAIDARFQDAMDRFRGADGIVIDLRGNPGGLAAMLMGISGHFVAERKTLGVMKTRDSELRFMANPRIVNGSGARVEPFGGPLAILVDAMSGSASECFAGGMQSIGRARVFGQPSMGQALPALFDRLPNGDVLIHAYGDFVTADGTRLEGRGVIPDEIQPLRREDLLAGRDRPLEAALAWIDAGTRASALAR